MHGAGIGIGERIGIEMVVDDDLDALRLSEGFFEAPQPPGMIRIENDDAIGLQ